MGDGRGAASHLRASWGSQGDGMTWWGEGGGIEGKARVWRNSCQVVLCGACLFFGGLSSLEIEGGEVVLDSSDECDGGRLVEGPRQWPKEALVSVDTG